MNIRTLIFASAVTLTSLVPAAQAQEINRIVANPNALFASVVAVPPGYTLYFVSGALPVPVTPAANGQPANWGDSTQQTQSVLSTLKASMAKAGLTFGDVVKATAFMGPDLDFAARSARVEALPDGLVDRVPADAKDARAEEAEHRDERGVVSAEEARLQARFLVAEADEPGADRAERRRGVDRDRRGEELLGLSQAIAHLAKTIVLARLSGHRVIALLYGKAVAAAFIALGLVAETALALPKADPAVMNLAAIARVTAWRIHQVAYVENL